MRTLEEVLKDLKAAEKEYQEKLIKYGLVDKEDKKHKEN